MLTGPLLRQYLLSSRAGALIRTIAWLCVASMTIGVLALVVVFGVMEGFNNNIRQRLLKVQPHLVVQGNASSFQNWVEKHPEVKVTPYSSQDVIVRTLDGLFSGAIALGRPEKELKDWLQTVEATKPEAVMRSSWESLELKSGDILLGWDLAESLGVYEGDELTVIPPEELLLPPGEVPKYEKVQVRGILRSDIPELDTRFLYYPQDQALYQFKKTASRESGWELMVPEPSRFEQWEDPLEAAGFQVESWAERNEALFFSLRVEKVIMTTFLSLATLITAFSIVSMMVLLITQKRKDMGIMMALGLPRKETRQLFARIGLALSALGMGTGLLLGGGVVFYLSRFPLDILPSDLYYDSTIPAVFSPGFLATVGCVCLLIGVLASWLPVRRSLQGTPAEMLRGFNREVEPR